MFFSIFVPQLWFARSERLRQDDAAVVHRGPPAAQHGRDLGAGRQARLQGQRHPRQARRLHAAGDCPVRRVLHQGDHDVLRLDLRHGHGRDHGAPPVPPQLPRPAEPKSSGQKPQVRRSSDMP